MASPCNSLNVQTLKVSQLANVSPTRRDILMLVKSSSAAPTLSSRRTSVGALFDTLFSSTGSYSGSFTGSLKGELIGTASYALTSSYIKFGTGTTNYYSIWTSVNDIAGTSGGSAIQNANNNVYFTKPIRFDNTNLKNFIFFRSSSYQNSAGWGNQPFKTFFRTTTTTDINNSFAMYCGGRHDNANTDDFTPGLSGSTILGTYYDNVGIGGFSTPQGIVSLLHLHLTASKLGTGNTSGTNPTSKTPWVYDYANGLRIAKKNPFRITSGSSSGVASTVATSAGAILLNVSASGQLDVKGDIVAFSTYGSSDERLKSNVESIENANEIISKLRPVSFTWNANNKPDFGLIAQEVEKELPQLIKEDLGGYKVVKYTSLIPLLLQEIQQLRKEVEELKKK